MTHRWTSIVLGLLLVIVCTSGAILVYQPELVRAANSELFATTDTGHEVGFTEAIAAVHAADPDFDAAYISSKGGVYFLTGDDAGAGTWFVDAGTGKVNGHGDIDGGFWGFMVNLHDCGLTCEGYPGYVAWLAQPSVIAEWGWFTADMTWGAVILGAMGLLLVFLAISGIVIWYPGLRKWRNGFRVRIGKGRFARDTDLHDVIGIVAAIPLLIWGLTGMNFEIPGVGKVWYSATGGVAPADDAYDMPTSEATGPLISLDTALAAAQAHYPGSHATWVGMPSDGAEYYSIDVLAGDTDLWAANPTYHGNRELGIDGHDPTIIKEFSGAPRSLSNRIADQWAQPMLHYGHAVNGWWRALWFGFGLTPLLLLLTGLSTWQIRNRTNRRRRLAARARRSAGTDRPETPGAGSAAEPVGV
ncbi:PepSY-associated TM helix domain-containing protein [Gordonia sp. VNK1]|uniref:PepSY-associated TM helix domain-containing protein n=1 Tax=Gordonia oleivorans TaxID=3156618 RepID=UPI0032B59A1B